MRILLAVMAVAVVAMACGAPTGIPTPNAQQILDEELPLLDEVLSECYGKVIERYGDSLFLNAALDGCEDAYYEEYYKLPPAIPTVTPTPIPIPTPTPTPTVPEFMRYAESEILALYRVERILGYCPENMSPSLEDDRYGFGREIRVWVISDGQEGLVYYGRRIVLSVDYRPIPSLCPMSEMRQWGT